ncbi:hypothetical protein ACSHWB_33975 [Lentzea sp. HUAS TT2]
MSTAAALDTAPRSRVMAVLGLAQLMVDERASRITAALRDALDRC